MNKELVDAYLLLDTNNKRDKLNREILVIGEMINKIEHKLGFTNEIDLYNYNPNTDKNITEDIFLSSTYQDIFNIERELITILKLLNEDTNK